MSTGIRVVRGQSVEIAASGRIKYWKERPDLYADPEGGEDGSCPQPTCFIKNGRAAALVGKISDGGDIIAIGTHRKIAVETSGELYLGINDPAPEDNTGSFSVVVDVS